MRLRRPKEPTAAERLEHEILHEPYRAWCQACVSGRGRYEYHRSRDHAEDAIPTIGVDYGYLASRARASEEGLVDSGADDGDLGGSPVLCGRCSADGWLDGYVLPAKGVEHPYCIDALTSVVKGCAFRRVLLKGDNEPAILALTQRTAAALRTETAIEVTLDPARQGDKDANGLAEGAVKEVKAKVRTLKYATEKLLGVHLTADHPVLPFLVMMACSTVNRGRRGVDGRTPYERRYGKPWSGNMARFW